MARLGIIDLMVLPRSPQPDRVLEAQMAARARAQNCQGKLWEIKMKPVFLLELGFRQILQCVFLV